MTVSVYSRIADATSRSVITIKRYVKSGAIPPPDRKGRFTKTMIYSPEVERSIIAAILEDRDYRLLPPKDAPATPAYTRPKPKQFKWNGMMLEDYGTAAQWIGIAMEKAFGGTYGDHRLNAYAYLDQWMERDHRTTYPTPDEARDHWVEHHLDIKPLVEQVAANAFGPSRDETLALMRVALRKCNLPEDTDVEALDAWMARDNRTSYPTRQEIADAYEVDLGPDT